MHVGLLLGRLAVGGAERQFVEIARGLAGRGHRVSFFTVYRGGALETDLTGVEGVELTALHDATGGAGVAGVVRSVLRLRSELRTRDPHVLYSALHAGNLIGAVAALGTRRPVVWGVRNARVSLPFKEQLPLLLGIPFGRTVAGFVSNSHEGLRLTRRRGYLGADPVVIHNGIRVDRFHPDPVSRERVRAAQGIAPDEVLVGLVGRVSPQKGQELFARVAGRIAPGNPKLRFAFVVPRSPGSAWRGRIEDASGGLNGRLSWIEAGSAIEEFYPALDVLCSASVSEGFANVIGEGMAAGLPVVATDAGDSARIVGDCGTIVPTGDPGALADALAGMAARAPEARRELGARARARIAAEFSVERLVERTERYLERIVGRRGTR